MRKALFRGISGTDVHLVSLTKLELRLLDFELI
ncbi:unnamed protein product, partial [Acanthocheilonema viteae]